MDFYLPWFYEQLSSASINLNTDLCIVAFLGTKWNHWMLHLESCESAMAKALFGFEWKEIDVIIQWECSSSVAQVYLLEFAYGFFILSL